MGCVSSSQAQKAPVPKPASVLPHDGNQEDIRDKYDLGKILGSGSFGQVREAILKDAPSAETRAVKMIERDNEDGEWSNQAIFVREVGLLQQINHENIIRYYDFYEDLHFLYVVMELCKGGEVFAKIVELKRFSETNAAVLGRQMLRAIEYIHDLHIAHRDIKAENFMLAEPSITSVVKMIDFGMACRYDAGQALTELCGSPHYLAPELIGQKYNNAADVWAFGVLLYLLMYGHYPYDAKHPRDIMVKILTEPIRWQTKVKLSKNALDFLRKLLEHDPKKRMSATEALQHSWMLLATKSKDEEDGGNSLPAEVIRSAHKKVTTTRKTVDPKIDELRNQKLKMIDEDFNKGMRHGRRLGETPIEDFMSKPEFIRRENKLSTAPSGPSPRAGDAAKKRGSLERIMRGDGASSPGPAGGEKRGSHQTGHNGLQAITEADQRQPNAAVEEGGDRKKARAMSVPKRLSYIGSLSNQEERNLATLYEEKSGAKSTARQPVPLGVLPDPSSGRTQDDHLAK